MIPWSVPRARMLAALCLGLMLASLMPDALPIMSAEVAQAQQIGTPGLWTTQFGRNAGDGRGLGPAVAYDREGYLHVVWFGGSTQDKWRIYYTNNRNGDFGGAVLIGEPRGENRDPDIAISSDNRIHVIYANDKNADIMYVESPDLGRTWLEATNLTTFGAKAYEPSIAVDANNTAHAVWVDRRSGKQQTAYAAKPVGGSWGNSGTIGGGTFDRYPEVTTTGRGSNVRVYVAYQGREGDSQLQSKFDIYLISSVGSRFLPPVNVSRDDGEWSLLPTIVSNGDNELYLAWDTQGDGSHDIVFARSIDQGQTWTRPANIARRRNFATSPTIAFGNSGNIPRVHIAWVEDFTPLYLLYEPANNSFGDDTEQVHRISRADQPDMAASNVTDEIAVGYQAAGGSNQWAYISTKGAGTVVSAQMTVDDGAQFTTKRQLTVKLSNVRGAPTQMRYAFNRAPTDGDPLVPLQTTFTVNLPADFAICTAFFNLQLQAVDGRRSNVIVSAINVDDTVQAAVDIRNPYFAGETAPFLPLARQSNVQQVTVGSAEYTRREFFYARIANAGECSSLARFYLGSSQNAYPLTNEGFVNVLPLPGGGNEGPRPVAIRVEDVLGNQKIFSRTVVLDRTPPEIKGGSFAIPTPQNGLPSVLADLVFENLTVSDNLYPGGRWGAYIVNVADPSLSDADASLQWQPVQVLQAGERLVISDWSVLSGIEDKVADQQFAGKTIEVRVKFLDGAGNISKETMTARVQLAQNFKPVQTFVSFVSR
jgi:hypothetical protein